MAQRSTTKGPITKISALSDENSVAMDQQAGAMSDSGRNSWISSAFDDLPLTEDSVDSSLELNMAADHKMCCGGSEPVTPPLYSQEQLPGLNPEVDDPENCAFIELCLDMTAYLNEVDAITFGQETIEFIDSDDKQTISPCQMKWIQYKEDTGVENYFVDTIMALPSREDVKYLFLNTVERVHLAGSIGRDLSEEDFSVVFIARGPDDQSSGTAALARHYAKLLVSLGVVNRSNVHSLDGGSCGCTASSRCIMRHQDKMGDVFPLQPESPSQFSPRKCILFSNVRNHCKNADELNDHLPINIRRNKPIVIIHGRMSALNKSLGDKGSAEEDYAQVPIFRMDPLTREELVVMAKAEFRKQGGRQLRYATDIDGNSWNMFLGMEPPNHDNSAFPTLGKVSGSEMKTVTEPPSIPASDKEQTVGLETISASVSKALRRQRVRVSKQAKRFREPGKSRNDLYDWNEQNLLTKADLIGARGQTPHSLLQPTMTPSYKELECLVGRGMQRVRDTILSISHNEDQNILRNAAGVNSFHLPFGRVFLGPPGCGKTTAAQLYASALEEIGLCSTTVTASAKILFSDVVGGEADKAQKLLDATEDYVLILKDIHMLDPGFQSMLSSPGFQSTFQLICWYAKRRNGRQQQKNCIILVGDADGMESLYHKVKGSGIETTFPLDLAMRFDNFTDDELAHVFRTRLHEKGLSASEEAVDVAIRLLSTARNKPNFGNVYAVDNLINGALSRFYTRFMTDNQMGSSTESSPAAIHMDLEPQDIDPSYGDLDRADEDLETMFDGFIDHSSVINTFKELNEMARGMQLRGLDPRPFIPFTYIFKGPPGTGKTTSARKLGQMFYNLGLLSSSEVVECSASSLIGHSGSPLLRQMEDALGKVLFIDEAYRLEPGGRGSSFSDEAIAELLDAVTKPKFAGKLIIVLAGYSKDMDKLLMRNPGMQSRFATEIEFRPLTIDGCLEYLQNCVGKVGIEVEDIAESGGVAKRVRTLLAKLSACKNWASARSIEKISEKIIAMVFKRCSMEQNATGSLTVAMATVEEVLDHMLQQNMKAGRV